MTRSFRSSAYVFSIRVLALAVLLFVAHARPVAAWQAAAPKRYLILATSKSSLPAHLASTVRRIGGTDYKPLAPFGIAFASSNNPNFASVLSQMPGIQTVALEPSSVTKGPTAKSVNINSVNINSVNINSVNINSVNINSVNINSVNINGTDVASVNINSVNINSAYNADPFADLQWGLLAIKAHDAHAVGAKGAGARVAILDMGADFNHPELYNRFNPLLSQSFVDGEGVQFTPGLGYPVSHATMMAGVIAASENGFGVEGVAPQAELVLVKVISDSGAGEWEALVHGIVYAAVIDCDVINMSLGGYMTTDGYDLGEPYDASDDVYIGAEGVAAWREALGRVATFAHKSGCTLVGAAGNDSLNRDLYSSIVHLPSDLPHVISVSGTGPLGYGLDQSTSLDPIGYYSNYGDDIDVAAPGGNIDIATYLSGELAVVAGLPAPAWLFDLVFTTDYGGYQVGLGTSFSAAHVSGVAALVAAERGNDRGAGAVAAIVVNSADDLGATGPDDFYGKGRVNALRAVQIGRGDNGDNDDGDED